MSLVGRSCSGKTRSAWEAVQERFPEWALAGFGTRSVCDDLVRQPPTDDTVVSLDDLQHYADPSALAADLRQVFAGAGRGHRIVAVATSWPRPAWETGRSSHVLDRPERRDLRHCRSWPCRLGTVTYAADPAMLVIDLGDEAALLGLAVFSRKAARELITWLA